MDPFERARSMLGLQCASGIHGSSWRFASSDPGRVLPTLDTSWDTVRERGHRAGLAGATIPPPQAPPPQPVGGHPDSRCRTTSVPRCYAGSDRRAGSETQPRPMPTVSARAPRVCRSHGGRGRFRHRIVCRRPSSRTGFTPGEYRRGRSRAAGAYGISSPPSRMCSVFRSSALTTAADRSCNRRPNRNCPSRSNWSSTPR
jgi:hypothetical protein